jgi:predicted DNA-binding transcriptional regulator AlpA
MARKIRAELSVAEQVARNEQTYEARRRRRAKARALRHELITGGDDDVLLTREEVAAFRGISTDTLDRMRRAGLFHRGRRVGKRKLGWSRAEALS